MKCRQCPVRQTDLLRKENELFGYRERRVRRLSPKGCFPLLPLSSIPSKKNSMTLMSSETNGREQADTEALSLHEKRILPAADLLARQ